MNIQNQDIQIRYIKTKNKIRKIATYISEDCRLRSTHKNINNFLKKNFVPSIFTKAYIEGCSIYHNALPHLYNDYFIMMDIKDFFPNISHKQLENKLYYEINRRNQNQINRLECHNLVELCSFEKKGLPLGFITSPILSNIYLKEFDNIFYGKLKQLSLNNIIYTRYADDMIVSFKLDNLNTLQVQKNIINMAENILSRYCLHLNKHKTRIYNLNVSNHVKITGVNIIKKNNDKRILSVGRSIKNKLYWEAINYFEATNKVPEKLDKIKGLQSFVLSIEKTGYESCYSKAMIGRVKKYGFDTLKQLIDSLKL